MNGYSKSISDKPVLWPLHYFRIVAFPEDVVGSPILHEPSPKLYLLENAVSVPAWRAWSNAASVVKITNALNRQLIKTESNSTAPTGMRSRCSNH